MSSFEIIISTKVKYESENHLHISNYRTFTHPHDEFHYSTIGLSIFEAVLWQLKKGQPTPGTAVIFILSEINNMCDLNTVLSFVEKAECNDFNI